MKVTDTTVGIKKIVGCLDRRDSAKYLSISTRLLDKLASAGEITRIKINRRSVFRSSDLDAFAESKIQRLEVDR